MTGGRSLTRGLVALLLISVLLAACGSSKPSVATAESKASGGTASGAASSAVAPSAKPAAGAPSSDSATSSTGTLPPLDSGQLIIRNGELDLTVKNLGDSLAAVRQVASDAGGSVFSSSTTSSGTNPSATLTLQVPSDRFDAVMTSLRSMSGVTEVGRENVTSQDVTDEYVDLQARQTNLQATEQQYLTLLTKATTISDTLAIEQQLSRVQGDLEQVKGRIKFLDQRTSYSRITLTIRAVVPGATSGTGNNLAHTALLAWQRSLHFVEAVARGVITGVVFLWWFWPLLAAGLYVRRRRQRGDTLPVGSGPVQ